MFYSPFPPYHTHFAEKSFFYSIGCIIDTFPKVLYTTHRSSSHCDSRLVPFVYSRGNSFNLDRHIKHPSCSSLIILIIKNCAIITKQIFSLSWQPDEEQRRREEASSGADEGVLCRAPLPSARGGTVAGAHGRARCGAFPVAYERALREGGNPPGKKEPAKFTRIITP